MMAEDSAIELMSLPVGTNTETQVDVRWESTSVVVPSSDDMGATRDAQLRTDVCPMMSEDSAMEPLSLPVVANMETQVDVGWESIWWWSRQVVEVVVRWDGSILNLTIV